MSPILPQRRSSVTRPLVSASPGRPQCGPRTNRFRSVCPRAARACRRERVRGLACSRPVRCLPCLGHRPDAPCHACRGAQPQSFERSGRARQCYEYVRQRLSTLTRLVSPPQKRRHAVPQVYTAFVPIAFTLRHARGRSVHSAEARWRLPVPIVFVPISLLLRLRCAAVFWRRRRRRRWWQRR